MIQCTGRSSVQNYWGFFIVQCVDRSGAQRVRALILPAHHKRPGKIQCTNPTLLKDPNFLCGLDGNGNMQIKRRQLNPERKMPSATVPDQYLLIDTTSYPPSFSSDTTYNKRFWKQIFNVHLYVDKYGFRTLILRIYWEVCVMTFLAVAETLRFFHRTRSEIHRRF